MNPKSILVQADYEEYLIRLHFGASSDYLQSCLNRAYRDFIRTMHGLRAIKDGPALYLLARNHLRQAIEGLSLNTNIAQDEFDIWHKQTCTILTEIYYQKQHPLYIGQAQKWINMTLKYIFTFRQSRLPGFSSLYSLCHVPLDNIFIEYLAPYNPPKLSTSWSRITDYSEYLNFQQWVRVHFTTIPLDTEFLIWLGKTPSLA